MATADAREPAQHPAALRARRGADDPRRLAAALRARARQARSRRSSWSCAGVRADPDAVAAYARVCGFALRDHLPPTYPHVLAFPLHMAVMADGSFPFGAVGLVHVENRIVQHRPDRHRRGADDPGPADPARAPPPRPHLLPRHRGTASATSRSGRAPAPCSAAAQQRRRGRRQAPNCINCRPSGRDVDRRRELGRERRSGGSAGTSGAATPPSPGIATRSTCTR